MKTLIGFFEEKPGVKSSERLKSFLIVLATLAFIYCFVIWLKKDPTTEFNFLVLIMFMAGVAPTGLRKIAEIRAGVLPKNESTIVTEIKQTDTQTQ